MLRTSALLLLVLGPVSLPAQTDCAPRRADSGYVALTGVTLWDGTGAPSRAGTTLLLQGERIAAIFPDGARPLPPGSSIQNLAGSFVVPGLIDTHVHVATEPSGEDSRARTERRLCRALLGGITAVRDMAGDVRALASLQRDALVGDIAAPDIYYAALWAGPTFFDDPRTATASAGATPGTLPWLRAIDASTDLRQAVAEARGTGATAIKLYAELTPELVAAITTEAHRQGLLVWAHAAMAAVSPRQTVDAGVDALSHATLLLRLLGREGYTTLTRAGPEQARRTLDDPRFDSLFSAMRRRGTLFEPTLFVYRGDREEIFPLAAGITRRAFAQGVTILAGTDSVGGADAGGWEAPNLHEELRLLVAEAGLAPADALTAATRTAARALGAERQMGTLQPGMLADLVVLDADPLSDIRNSRRVRLVIKRGAIYPGGPTLPR